MENAKWSLQHTIFLVIQIGTFGVVCWFWFSLPAPGWAVAILAGVAAAMSIHGDMRPWQKVSWMVHIGNLLVIELRAISKDRADNDAKALADRQAQDLAFKTVRETQDADFNGTASGLEAAISGIQSTLTAANLTMAQTKPHAVLQQEEFRILNPPTAPEIFKAGVDYKLNLPFRNAGNEPALLLQRHGEIYVGKPDEKEAQEKIDAKFEKAWEDLSREGIPSRIPPGAPGYWSETRAFSNVEVEDLTHKDNTVYQ